MVHVWSPSCVNRTRPESVWYLGVDPVLAVLVDCADPSLPLGLKVELLHPARTAVCGAKHKGRSEGGPNRILVSRKDST